MRCQEIHRRQVNITVREHLEYQRTLPSGARRRDPRVRLVLREMQHLRAVCEERRTGFGEIQLARIDLGEMRDKLRGRRPLVLDQ